VTRGHPGDTAEIAVESPQVTEDVDTPEQYERLRAQLAVEPDDTSHHHPG
jgi:hypothetical protein